MATMGNPLGGRLAATGQAIEIQKLVDGNLEDVAAGCEVLHDAGHHVHFVSRLVRNPSCRGGHERWEIAQIVDQPLREALQLAEGSAGGNRLSLPDSAFVSQLLCPRCGHADPVWRLREGLEPAALPCPQCSTVRVVRGFDLLRDLTAKALPAALLERPLSERGIREGDVFAVENPDGSPRYFELRGLQPVPQRHSGRDLVIGGLGNIGSFLIPAVARIPGIERVTLADFDRYEDGNRFGQDFAPWGVDRNKAEVQAERLRGLRPGLEVRAFPGRAEELPLGALRGAITVSCLDSRAARLRLAARAWRAGSPFVDAAVEGGQSLLVRTSVFLPSDEGPCFECAFSDRDYRNLEQTFPCEILGRPAAPATGPE